jgi:hypothetical protein
VLTLHATGDVLSRFPHDLFFDDEVVWHRQQYGQPGHVAFAMFVTAGKSLYGLNYVSDIVQRQSRAQDHRTQIQARFNGWPHMLFNAVLGFAVEHAIETVWSPTADMVIRNTDPTRTVEAELFGRVYDAAVTNFFITERAGDWWSLDVPTNAPRVVRPELKSLPLPAGKRICLTHDIERGLGHIDADLDFAHEIHWESQRYLDQMLADERRVGVHATYNVVGCMFHEVKHKIAADNHCLAFHSYDHLQGGEESLEKFARAAEAGLVSPSTAAWTQFDSAPGAKQLSKCRTIDYRTRGYRAPNSRLTAELTSERLLRSNFDWLASSDSSLDTIRPMVKDSVVQIPIMFDDFPLHIGEMDYRTWESWALDCIGKRDFVAFGLHDCYGHYWLKHYQEFLQKIAALGALNTCDQIADDAVLANCA